MPGSRGVPPKKRGRFIPCRGGGTATTYYTDWHNVDEDLTAIAEQSGGWTGTTGAGVTERYMKEIPSEDVSHVASRLIYLS